MTERELYPTPRNEDLTGRAAPRDESGDTPQESRPEGVVERYSAHVSSGGTVSRGYKLMFFDLDEA